MIVDLSEHWDKIVETGKTRNENNKKRGSRNFRVSNKVNDEEAHIWGVAGEVATKLSLGLPLDEVWDTKIYGKWPDTDGEYFGDKYQVKFRMRRDADMLYNPNFMNLKAELYILVVPNNGKKVEVAGWINKKELNEKKRLKNLGYGDVYLIDREHFKPIRSLIYEKAVENI